MPRLRPLVTLFAFGAVIAGRIPSAHAEEEASQVDSADGSDECAAFQAKNLKELRDWERSQPPVPYHYPREKTVLNAPWGRFFDGFGGRTGELALATLLPAVGAQLRGAAPAMVVSWPWSVVVFGPMSACTRKKGTFVVHGHRAHRLMVEPAVVSSNRGVGFSVRPGYRFLWHPSSWVIGPGVGLGSTIEIAGNKEPFRYSIGPELVARFGACCTPSYFTFAFRYDHYFDGSDRDIVGGTLGYTFF